MEWLEDMVSKFTREINSNSTSETEEIMERHEKYLDQLDKKKKIVMDQKAKGDKILSDPKAPKFFKGHMERLVSDYWVAVFLLTPEMSKNTDGTLVRSQ